MATQDIFARLNEEHFPAFPRHLTAVDDANVKRVFDRRKPAKMASAVVTLEQMEDAKE